MELQCRQEVLLHGLSGMDNNINLDCPIYLTITHYAKTADTDLPAPETLVKVS